MKRTMPTKKNSNKFRRKNGFSLFEILVSMLLLATLAAVAGEAFSTAFRLEKTDDDYAAAWDEMDNMAALISTGKEFFQYMFSETEQARLQTRFALLNPADKFFF